MELKLNKTYLLTECQEFDFSNPPFDPVEFSQQLVKLMYEKNGLGLAANQVGYNYRVFSMRGSPENFVFFNPKIVDFSEKAIKLDEGCISYPGVVIPIKRPEAIRVRFNTPSGEVRTDKFVGLAARVIQHEFEHINGKPFYRLANKYHIDKGFRNSK